MPSSLTIVDAPDRPLTPEQRKFNQLVQKVERARADLLAWQDAATLFAGAHAEKARPLQAQLAACRADVALRLDQLVAQPGWTRTERQTMRDIICAVAGSLVGDASIAPEQADAMKALHDRHADIDFDTGSREAMTAMKGLFEAMSGVDLGDKDFESEEDMLAHARDRMREREQQTQDAQAAAQPPKRAGAAQRRREQEAEQASQSVRDVFRKLASALHPDRADGEADRVYRSALMQRVNQAYQARDLLALFALQLEIEQVDAGHLARATADRLRHYNRVLAAQLAELQDELRSRQAGFRIDHGFEPTDPVGVSRLGALLRSELATLRAQLAQAQLDLLRLEQPPAVKRWLKMQRALMQDADGDDFF